MLVDILEEDYHDMADSTLKLRRPFGQTLLLSIVLLAFMLLFGEIITRSTWFQSRIAVWDWGTNYRNLSRKLDQLETIAAQKGSIDCLFLGNSMVLRGFDPESFALAYQNQTGQSIQCFNFGIQGMPAAGAGALVNVLVDDFQPRILFYGVDPYDFSINPNAKESTIVTEMAWLRYRQGEFNPKGWLVENSVLYKSRKAIYLLLRFDIDRAFNNWDQLDDEGLSALNGYDPVPEIILSVMSPPDSDDGSKLVQFLYDLFSDFTIYRENVSGLQEVISQSDKDLQVILVQMPVPPTYMHFFGEGEKDYERFMKLVEDSAQNGQTSFIKTVPAAPIPDQGWIDYGHLNASGAEFFSQWLGAQFGRLVSEGKVVLSEEPRK